MWLKQLGVNIGVNFVNETIKSERHKCCEWKNYKWMLEWMLWMKQLGVNVGVNVVTETIGSERWSEWKN